MLEYRIELFTEVWDGALPFWKMGNFLEDILGDPETADKDCSEENLLLMNW